MVNSLASHFGYKLIHVHSGSIKDKFVGGSEKRLTKAFDTAFGEEKVIIFMDEVRYLAEKFQLPEKEDKLCFLFLKG